MDEETKKILEDHERRIKTLEKGSESDIEVTVAKKQLPINDFLFSKKPVDDVQKALTIGYFLEKFRSIEAFNTKDLEDGFREAKESVPANINDVVNNNIRKGNMMEAKEKKDKLKAWNLTSSGERFVENDFKE